MINEIKKFTIGDLITQKIVLEAGDNQAEGMVINRCGIIVDVNNSTITIEWSNKEYNDPQKKLVIFNTTLRKMIMHGSINHFSAKP